MLKFIFLFTILFAGSLAVAGGDKLLDFSPFMYKVKGSCENISKLSFSASKNTYVILGYGENIKGQELSVSTFIQLFSDGTYWLRYKERTKVEQVDNIHVYIKNYEKDLVGNYSISDGEIEVEHLGKGQIIDAGSSTLIELKLDKIINDSRVLGHNIYLNKVSSSRGPEGISKNHFCSQD